MRIATEKKLRDFEFWAGAKVNAAKLTSNELDQLEETLEEQLEWDDKQYWDETEINDLMWFAFEEVCEWLGLDPEEVEARK